MRIRRQVKWEALTDDQKKRAVEAQQRFVNRFNATTMPNVINQTGNLNVTSYSSSVNDRRQSMIMRNKMTFEEKYNVQTPEQPKQEGTQVFATIRDLPKVEDEPVPPSLEEDPNQASPIPEDMLNLEVSDGEATEGAETQSVNITDKETLMELTLKELKEKYRELDSEKNIEYINNKSKMVDLILEKIWDGTREEG